MLSSHEFWAVALPVIFIGYCVFGMSGFGSSLITVPLLSHVAAPAQLLPMLVVLDFSAALVMGARFHGATDRSEVMLMIPFTVIGAVLGVTLLVNLPRQALLLSIGTFTLAYAACQLYEPTQLRRVARAWAPLAGVVAGTMGTLFGAGAPPYVMYLTRRLPDKTVLRATIATMAVLSIGARLAVFTAAGLMFDRELWIVFALLAPVAGLGLFVGHRAHSRVSRKQMLRVIGMMLAVSGVSLLARVMW